MVSSTSRSARWGGQLASISTPAVTGSGVGVDTVGCRTTVAAMTEVLGMGVVMGTGDFGFTSKADDVHGGTQFGGRVIGPVNFGQIATRDDVGNGTAGERAGDATDITRSNFVGADKGML